MSLNTEILEKVTPLYAIAEELTSYLELQLTLSGDDVKSYIEDRGLSEAMISLFRLGYCPDGQAMYDFASTQDGWLEALSALGFWKVTDEGDIYVKFENRLMFPFISESGLIHGYSGRVTHNVKVDNKYVNTSNCATYNKSLMVYGLREALITNQKIDKWILVEGTMDVISMFQAGYTTAVACAGTAVTEWQLRRLKQYCNNFVLLLDNDLAGKKASTNVQNLMKELRIQYKAPTLDEFKDVDEAIHKGRLDLVEQAING